MNKSNWFDKSMVSIDNALNGIKGEYLEVIYKPKFIALISFIFFLSGLIFYNSSDTSSLISTIISSLASILAITISLTLVAVQLSAQNYSTRILSLFISSKNRTFWIIIFLYLFSIIFGLILLSIISDDELNALGMFAVSFNVVLALWCILVIPKYIKNILIEIDPENIVSNLSNDINEDSIRFNQDNKIDGSDPLVPLTDIILSSIRNSDNDTLEKSFSVIKEQFSILIENENINQEKQFVKYILRNMEYIRDTAILKGNTRSIGLIIDLLDVICIPIVIKTGSKELIDEFLLVIADMSKTIVEFEAVHESEIFIKFFDDFGSTYEHEFYNARMRHLNNMWFESIKKIESKEYIRKVWADLDYDEESPIEAKVNLKLTGMRVEISEKGLLSEITEDLKFLLNFGIHAIDHYPNRLSIVINSIDIYNQKLFEKGIDNAMELGESKEECYLIIARLIDILKILGIESIEKNKYETEDYEYHDFLDFKIEEIVRFDFVVLEEIINKLFIIGSFAQDYSTYNRENSKEIDANKIVIKVIDALEMIAVLLITKKSSLIEDVMRRIKNLGVPLMKMDFNEEIAKYSFNSLSRISNKLIDNNSQYIVNLGGIIGDMEHYGLYHEQNVQVREWSVKCLGRIGLELSQNIEHKDKLKYIFSDLCKIAKDLLKEKLDDEAERCLETMQSIFRNMDKNKFKGRDKRELLKYFDSIKKYSNENGLSYPENIDKWVDRIRERGRPQVFTV
ncbi:MAG: DUF2254 family protein [Methanobacterium sp.]